METCEIEDLISIKIDFSKQIAYVSLKLFYHVQNIRKKVSCGCKIQISFIGG